MNETTNLLEQCKNEAVKALLVSVVNSTSKTGARFGSFKYTNEQGETSRYTVMFGINILSLYKSDLRTLERMLPMVKNVDGAASPRGLACAELLQSVRESLTVGIGNNSRYTLKGYYHPITPNGEVKFHIDEQGNQFLYVRGYVLKKTVLEKGEYKHVNSSDKTLAKKQIEKTLKRGKIRTFKINVNVLHTIKVNGMTLEIE
jgi:hypothetical protein